MRDAARVRGLVDLGTEVVEGDITDAGARVRAVEGVEAVVNVAAAFRGVSDEHAVDVNRHAAVGLAEAALDAGVRRFVHTSTGLVYPGGLGRPAAETDEPASGGTHVYPVSKAAADRALVELHRTRGLPLRIARLAFVYGEGDPHLAESHRFIADWSSAKRLHMVHHADVGQALLRMATADGLDGAVVNVADDAPTTAWELARLTGRSAPVRNEPVADAWESVLDTTRFRTVLGLRPLFPTVHTAVDAGAL
ncbi:nucleoside-diphosphate-sugar epimerase [Actinokineospora auranticolor]|uniref:Nucleoside-diphosphate-sugar epimerase n=1 Tax=Actinokineospora auranticolor TaxID=155976 RepID=A0A2S6GPC6_9PSEU|nr:nucleoside-diphosphate-sugar epimerase [Actinokineospora auranticolor]